MNSASHQPFAASTSSFGANCSDTDLGSVIYPQISQMTQITRRSPPRPRDGGFEQWAAPFPPCGGRVGDGGFTAPHPNSRLDSQSLRLPCSLSAHQDSTVCCCYILTRNSSSRVLMYEERTPEAGEFPASPLVLISMTYSHISQMTQTTRCSARRPRDGGFEQWAAPLLPLWEKGLGDEGCLWERGNAPGRRAAASCRAPSPNASAGRAWGEGWGWGVNARCPRDGGCSQR